jgi:hypothetical protein
MKKIIDVEYLIGETVWFIYNNKIANAPISEINLTRKGANYIFWWQDLKPSVSRENFDKSIHSQNQFFMSTSKFFPTKEALLNSL